MRNKVQFIGSLAETLYFGRADVGSGHELCHSRTCSKVNEALTYQLNLFRILLVVRIVFDAFQGVRSCRTLLGLHGEGREDRRLFPRGPFDQGPLGGCY